MVDTEAGSLLETPTWAVAAVCSVLITISIFMEHALHLLIRFVERKKRKSLDQALYKIKSELMLLGFISLLLTVAEQPISKICIPKKMGYSLLPCSNNTLPHGIPEEPSCVGKGKISLVSRTGINQLQILIFVMALSHVLSCILTMGLGMAKMKKWQAWEAETRSVEYQFSYDPRRFTLTHQTSFGKRHLRFWSEHPLLIWPACFFRQFTGSVSKTDYFVLRHGFITAHFNEASEFDFQNFLRRALDEDFSVVVGISLWIWIFSVAFILLNAHRFHNYYWLPFTPLIMALIVGTKLQVIITKMCLESRNKAVVVKGTLLVQPKDSLFWFGRPRLLVHLIHFILFQNSFQLAFFSWTWYKFGLRSCFHKETEDIAIRLATGLLVQLLVGYVTLPLYGLVTQMGSSMRKMVFTDVVAQGLQNWHTAAKRNLEMNKSTITSPSPKSVPVNLAELQGRQVPDNLNSTTSVAESNILAVEIEVEEEAPIQKKSSMKKNYDREISFG